MDIQVLSNEQTAKMFDLATTDITWQQVVERWKAGKSVWSAELGGIGPGYEQAIQVLLFEILARWEGEPPKHDPESEKYPEHYSKHADRVADELNKDLGFSGAQVGVAKATAYQFMAFGYEHMMSKLPEDRKILVSRDFPNLLRPA